MNTEVLCLQVKGQRNEKKQKWTESSSEPLVFSLLAVHQFINVAIVSIFLYRITINFPTGQNFIVDDNGN